MSGSIGIPGSAKPLSNPSNQDPAISPAARNNARTQPIQDTAKGLCGVAGQDSMAAKAPMAAEDTTSAQHLELKAPTSCTPRAPANFSAAKPYSLVQINAYADGFVHALETGGTKAALDSIYGIPKGPKDTHFARHFKNALVAKAGDDVLKDFSTADRLLLSAYLQNPSGMAENKDLAALGFLGHGTGETVVLNVVRDLRGQARLSPEGFDVAFPKLLAEFDQEFRQTYGKTFEGRTFHEQALAELNGDDRVSYLAARLDDDDVALLHSASEGLFFGTEENTLMAVLERNLHRMDAFAKNYAAATAHTRGVHGPLRGSDTLLKMLPTELSGSELVRARLLVSGDGKGYVEATLRAMQDGDIDETHTVNRLKAVLDADGGVAGWELDAELIAQIHDEGHFPYASAMLSIAQKNGDLKGQEAMRQEALHHLKNPEQSYLALSDFFESLDEDQRLGLRMYFGMDAQVQRAFAAAEASAAQKVAAYHEAQGYQLGAIESPTLTPQMAGLVDPADVARKGERVHSALMGTLTPAKLLALHAHGLASADEVAQAVSIMPIGERREFAAQYDQKHGQGAFEKALKELPDKYQDSIRQSLAMRGFQGDDAGVALQDLRKTLQEVVAGEREGLSAVLMDRFGFGGPVVDDALRAAENAVLRLKDKDPVDALDLLLLQQKVSRLQRALMDYAGEREDYADNAMMVTTVFVGVGVGLVTGGMGTAAIVTAAASVGVTGVATKYAFLGDDYSPEDAMLDFVLLAGFEGAGMLAMRGAGKVLSAAKGNPTHLVSGTSTGTTSPVAAEVPIQTIVRSAEEAYKGSTRLGHALSKHAGRRPELWGRTRGAMSGWHAQAMEAFRTIIEAPGSFATVANANGRTFLEKWVGDRGIRLNMDWTFKGFVDA